MAFLTHSSLNFKAVLKQIFGDNINKDYKLTGSLLLIGRSPKCHIKITSPSISRKHCVLTRISTGWSVKDNKSQNGTYINGRQLRPDEEYLLQCGDILFLGPPSELPQAFSYEELVGNDSDDDIFELPQKHRNQTQQSLCEPNTEISSKKTSLNIPCSSKSEALKRRCVSSVSVVSDSSKFVPPAPKKNKSKRRIELTPSPSKTLMDSSNFSNSTASIAASSKSKNNLNEMNIDNVEQSYEISSTNDDCDNSESLLHTEFQDIQDDNEEVFKKENNKNAEKEEELTLKLALLSQEIKALQASQMELQKNYQDVCEKNKELDKELIDKEKKMEKELQMYEVKAKNEVKSELLEKFEEDLVCNICTELFIKPTVLDCSHTFCEFCINEWRKKKNDCPICRCKIRNITQVRTLEQFIDKTLSTLTPDQKLKRANVIAERNIAERPPIPPTGRGATPRRRRGSHRHRNHRHPRTSTNNSNQGNGSIQVVHESGRPDYSHTIFRLTPGGTESPRNFVDLTQMGISVIFG